MRLKVQVKGRAELDREIERLRKELGLKGGEFADFAARAVRDGVVRNAHPFGKGKKARAVGVNAVRGDLMKCFRVVPDLQGRRKGVIASLAEARAFHQQRRGPRGRVRRGERRRVTSSIFKEYFEEVAAKVGMAKASVAGGDDPKLKTRLPLWLRPWTKTGDAMRRRGPAGAMWKFSAEPEAVASDRVLGIRGVMRVARKQKRLVLGALRRDVRRMLKKKERQVNR